MRSLAVKLTLAFLLVGLTGALLVTVVLELNVRSAFGRFVLDRDQQALVTALQDYYQTNRSWQGLAGRSGEGPGMGMMGSPVTHPGTVRFTLLDADRNPVLTVGHGRAGGGAGRGDSQNAVPLQVDGDTVGYVIMAEANQDWIPSEPEQLFLNSVNRASLFGGLVAAGLALGLGGLLAFTLTRSLREMTEATQAIARGSFGQQVRVRTKDELGRLALSFNRMSQELARAINSRRQMTADIAHDLRTPLSVISGYTEALSDGKLEGTPEVYEILYGEAQHLSRLVEDLRTLSLVDAGELPINRQTVAPQAFLERVAARHEVTAHQRGIGLQVAAEPGLPEVSIDPERLVQVFDNLVSNAFRYTPAGGQVGLAAVRQGGQVALQVSDTGSGIAPQDLPNIFNRFYRGDPARQQNGESGLGLAIARSIVEAHGGEISAENLPAGGACFTVLLPASQGERESKISSNPLP